MEPEWHGRPFPAGMFVSTCEVPGNLLNDGLYQVSVLAVQDCATLLFSYPDVLAFEVHDSDENRGNWYGEWIGAVRPQLKWETKLVSRL
jgi:lipopolysaccharide transport system ATP-binding protein